MPGIKLIALGSYLLIAEVEMKWRLVVYELLCHCYNTRGTPML